jgi:hypothetical protein
MRERVRALLESWRRWLDSRIPPLTATQLGVFRVVFALALFAVFLREAGGTAWPEAFPRELHRAYSPIAAMEWAHWLAASEFARRLLWATTLLALGCFAVGLATRVAYGVVATSFFVHTVMILEHSGVHNLSVPTVTLLCLLPVPWGDGFSLDARRRGGSTSNPWGSAYGYALWLPRLTLGLAFTAAAIAKLQYSGLQWITSGAVKYHFVEDGLNAPTTFGLWIASHPSIAVLCSLGAIAVEGAALWNVFVRGRWGRLAFGIAVSGLLLGFYLFQGVFWRGWWTLLLAFLPWERLPAGRTGPAPRRQIRGHHAGIAALLVGAQIYATLARIEVEPLLSWFPMYANTWPSEAAFNAGREEKFSRYTFRAGGRDVTAWLDQARGGDLFIRAARIPRGEDVPDDLENAMLGIARRYAAEQGNWLESVEVLRDRQAFNWREGRFVQAEHQVSVGTVHLGGLGAAGVR